MKKDTKAALDAWLATLKPAKMPNGMTSGELAEAWGVSTNTCRARMKLLAAVGRLRYAGKRQSVRLDGRPDYIPVYQIVKPTAGE